MFGAGFMGALETFSTADGGGPNVAAGGDVSFNSGASVGQSNSSNSVPTWSLIAVGGVALVAIAWPMIRKGR